MPALTAAWLLTKDRHYGDKAAEHLRAWFVDPATRMNPNLEYSQGVTGVVTGRSYGIIDTLHLVEVARAVVVSASSGSNRVGRRDRAHKIPTRMACVRRPMSRWMPIPLRVIQSTAPLVLRAVAVWGVLAVGSPLVAHRRRLPCGRPWLF